MNGQPKMIDVDVDREDSSRPEKDWKLDEYTKSTGREGVKAARAALAACEAPDIDLEP